MLLTVFCLRRDRSELTFSLQVDAEFELQNFRALCELESGIPAAESQIVYAQQPLTDNRRSLASYGLKDGDVVLLQQVGGAEAAFPGLPRIDFSSIAVPGTSAQLSHPRPAPARPTSRPAPELPPSPPALENPALLREMLLANPHELSLLKERNPPLAEALLSGDLERFAQVLVEQQQDRARREQERIRLFSADPFDLEAQAKIEEDIRQQNIEENMTIAMEEAPESFGQVVMLYINCKVNGHPVKAFVDSGAQMTIMSQACAERCNIMRLVDRRWAGVARGVGTQKIMGRVHLAQVQIEGDFLPCSFSILEEQPMDMLLGLDMLKRHQCSIDLKKNVLVIGTTGSQTGFLPEGELPECAKLAYGVGREEARPEELADQELAEALQKSAEEAENSNQETTSLETPSLPPPEGLERFPEPGLKTNDSSASQRLTASAPLGNRAEMVGLQAAKSLDSLTGHLATPSEEPPALPPNHLDRGLPAAGPSKADPTGRGSPEEFSASPETATSNCPSGEEDIPGLDAQEAGGGSPLCPASGERGRPGTPWLLDATEHLDVGAPRTWATHEASAEPKGQQLPCKAAILFSPASLVGTVEDGGDGCSTEQGMLGPPGASSPLEPDGRAFPLPRGPPPLSSLTHSGKKPCAPAGDQDQDPGLSLSSALKELHRLLIASSKQEARGPEAAAAEEVSQEKCSKVACSLPEGAGLAGAERPREQETPLALESSRSSFSPFANQPVALSDECSDLAAPGFPSGQLPGHNAEGQRALPLSSFPGDPGGSEAERLPSLPFPTGPHHPPPPSGANVDQLVGAGFTPQEAGEALEHAGGNAELALLILLARNIVVPT